MAFEGPVVIFDGPEDYHKRIDSTPGITEKSILIMRGAGPQGYPGAAEVVNMLPPAELIQQGIELPCIGDGRQSGTCGTPAILNASPEAADGGLLGYLKDGDVVRVDLLKRSANARLTPEEIAERRKAMPTYRGPRARRRGRRCSARTSPSSRTAWCSRTLSSSSALRRPCPSPGRTTRRGVGVPHVPLVTNHDCTFM
jgi:dihydroxyacid dehydratase/phosphogluconate dehydratase